MCHLEWQENGGTKIMPKATYFRAGVVSGKALAAGIELQRCTICHRTRG